MLSLRGTKEFDIEKFILTNLNETEGEDEYRVKVLNKF
jgi:hypothetical protein